MRYVRADRKPVKCYYDDYTPLIPNLEVDGEKIVDTGLIWEDGSKIMRTQNPIGFGRDKEW